jgi:osmotically-inducible protein OsmY
MTRTVLQGRASMRAPALFICLAAGLTGCAAFAQGGLLESPADARISAEVRTLLERSPALDAPNLISVETRAGVVYLRGLVSTPYQVGAAGSLAAEAPGASQVANLLSIDNAR